MLSCRIHVVIKVGGLIFPLTYLKIMGPCGPGRIRTPTSSFQILIVLYHNYIGLSIVSSIAFINNEGHNGKKNGPSVDPTSVMISKYRICYFVNCPYIHPFFLNTTTIQSAIPAHNISTNG